MTNVLARLGLVLINLCTLCALECGARPAHASFVDMAVGDLEFTSNVQVANALTMAQVGGIYVIKDPAETIVLLAHALQAGCAQSDPTTVSCPAVAVTSLRIRPGDGDDSVVLTGVPAPANIDGGFGNDVIVGGDGDDVISCNPGGDDDTIDGALGEDSLSFFGGNGSESINIVAEGDGFSLFRNLGNGVLLHVVGVEALDLDSRLGFDNIATVPLRNTIQFIQATDGTQVSPDALTVHAGGLCVVRNGSNFEIEGRPPIVSAGIDLLSLDGAFCRLDPCVGAVPTSECTVNGVRDQLCQGTDGADVIVGTKDSDVILGGTGADRIRGGAGDDLICGEGGDDALVGARGNDVIFGGPGLDTIRGDSGNDTLVGGDDADNVIGGSGDDDLDGNLGDDRLRAGAGADTLRGGDGIDLVDGAGGVDTCLDTDQIGLFSRCELP